MNTDNLPLIDPKDIQIEDAKSEIETDEVGDNVTVADDASETEAHATEDNSADKIDYASLIAEDIAALKAEFPELVGITDITELNNPLRYAALRDLGLSPAEAYMATAKRRTQDTRSHLKSAHGKGASASVTMMSQLELRTARDLFPGMSDSEIQRLYKRVTN